jgi:hypothetical protein
MKRIALIGFYFAGLLSAISQNVVISENGGAPDNSAMLEVVSSDKGILIPRLTEAQRNSILSPAASLLIYQTDNTEGFYFNFGNSISPNWTRLAIPSDRIIPDLNTVLTEGNNANAESLLNVDSMAVDIFSPNLQFQVNESAGSRTGFQFTETANGTGSSDGFRLVLESGAVQMINGENSSLFFLTNSALRKTILANGNVGLNTTTPAYRLDVNGGSRINRLNINSAFTFPTIDGSNGEVLITDGFGNLNWGSRADNLGNHIASQNVALSNNFLSGDSDNEGLRISHDGNVGIAANSNFSKVLVYDNTLPILRTTSADGAINSAVSSGVIELAETNTANFTTNGTGFRLRYVGDGVATDRLEISSVSAGTLTLRMSLKRNSGYVGIKITEPATQLHMVHANSNTDGWAVSNAADNDKWHLNVQSANDAILYFNNTARLVFNYTSGAVTAPSDARLKKNITEQSNLLERLLKINPTEYVFKDDEKEEKQLGVLAQNLLKSFPDLVLVNKDLAGKEVYTVNYSGLNAIAIGAAKEQYLQLQELENRLDKLEETIK